MKVLVASQAGYRADIDGLRCIAVLAVLTYHAFPARLAGGFVGVDVFFVISGYLITGILQRSIEGGEAVLLTFYRRRIRRIFPALALVLAAVLFGGGLVLLADDYSRLGKHTAAGAGFVANIIFWSEASYFDTAAATKPLLHLWSLGVEEQFYIVWPLLLIGAYRLRLSLSSTAAILAAGSFALAVVLVETDATAAFYSPLTRFWELLFGALLVIAERSRNRSLPFSGAISSSGLILIGGSCFFLSEQTPFPGLWALPSVLGTALVIAAGPAAWPNRMLLSLRPAVWLGLFSYPLYLWHWPLLSFAYILNYEQVLSTWVRIMLLLVSMVLAWMTWRLIERPRRIRKHFTIPRLGLTMAAVLIAGLVVQQSHGIPTRPVNKDQRREFVAFYQNLHRNGLFKAYRDQCDFLTWGSLKPRSQIDPRCTARKQGPYVLLWGDSHAQALSLGISEQLEATQLYQIATSGCRPNIGIDRHDYLIEGWNEACRRSNSLAMQVINREKPDLLILAQADGHLEKNWEALSQRLQAAGAKRILLVGPLPQWRPSLPIMVVVHHWPYKGEPVSEGLDQSIIDVDRSLHAKARNWSHLGFASVIDSLCDDRTCMAEVPNAKRAKLLAVDYGHLSPSGSSYVARTVLREHLLPYATSRPPER